MRKGSPKFEDLKPGDMFLDRKQKCVGMIRRETTTLFHGHTLFIVGVVGIRGIRRHTLTSEQYTRWYKDDEYIGRLEKND